MRAAGETPESLGVVRAFVDTYDTEDDRDELTSPVALRAWLAQRRLLSAADPVAEADLERAVRVREALRSLMLANTGEPIDAGALEVLNAAAADASLIVQFSSDGVAELRPETPGVAGALGRLLARVFGAMADGTWARVKVCLEDTCRVTYYDQSRNRSRTWCSMEVCGNRTKARKFRERHRAGSGQEQR